jgi:capsular polysaccharide biosynthesis protein
VRSISRRGWQRERRDDLPLYEVVHVLWGRRLLVVGIVVSLVLFALLFGLFREPVYTAEAAVSVEPREERLLNEDERDAFMEEVQGAVVTEYWLRGVMRRAGWEADAREFRERLDFETVARGNETGLLVRFSGTGPEQAARAANAYAELFVGRIERLNESRLAGGALAADAVVERRAVPPEGSSLRLLLYAVAAVAAGVLAGGAGALLLEGRTRSWRDARDAELTLRAPVLGVIPDYSSVGEED